LRDFKRLRIGDGEDLKFTIDEWQLKEINNKKMGKKRIGAIGDSPG